MRSETITRLEAGEKLFTTGRRGRISSSTTIVNVSNESSVTTSSITVQPMKSADEFSPGDSTTSPGTNWRLGTDGFRLEEIVSGDRWCNHAHRLIDSL